MAALGCTTRDRYACRWHRVNFSIKFLRAEVAASYAIIIFFEAFYVFSSYFNTIFYLIFSFYFNSNDDKWSEIVVFLSLSQMTFFHSQRSCTYALFFYSHYRINIKLSQYIYILIILYIYIYNTHKIKKNYFCIRFN